MLAGGAWALSVLCWLRAAFTDPGRVPDDPRWQYKPEIADIALPSTKQTKRNGERRHCKWCEIYKPDRTHHCRVCKRCALKMDHHDPWINNCVGFRNFAFFVQGWFYQGFTQMTLWASIMSAAHFVMDPQHSMSTRCIVCAASVSNILDGFCVSCFCVFHFWLIFKGHTTIDFFEKKIQEPPLFDLGPLGNLKAALGAYPFLMFLPIKLPQGDGLSFNSGEATPVGDGGDNEALLLA